MRLRDTSYCIALLLVACAAETSSTVTAEMGEAVPGLSDTEARAFAAGRGVFARIYTPAEGLGPRFNENSCSACHTFPVDGGTGETAVRKATRHTADGTCDLLSEHGGLNLRLQATPALAAGDDARVPTPSVATHAARFTIPFVFGLGLVDAIPLASLEARADPEDADGDGVSGRLGRDVDGRPARFGRKADVATLEDFVDSALRLEMGLTTPRLPDEAGAGSIPPVGADVDPTPEPEIDAGTFDDLTAFVRFLAPPAPADAEGDPSVQRGRELFEELGCAACHAPVLRTGSHPSAALRNRAVALYSDLLLHDMGPGLEGTCAPGASTTEYRTEPLMGLRYRDTYLHDGRSRRVRDAILLHGGEAEATRRRFSELDRLQQEALLGFLGTL